MDLMAVAEWSRFVVGSAMIVYLGSWLAFSSEMGLRARLRRRDAAVVEAEVPALASVGAATDPRDGEGSPGAAPAAASEADDLNLAELADARGRLGAYLLVTATAILAAGVLMRGIGTGRMPWANMHEFSITAGLVASVVFIMLARSTATRVLAAWGVLAVFVTLALAVTWLYVPPGELMPALRSYWLVLHVGCAVLAFALFTVAAVANALQLVAERAERRGITSGFAAQLPASSVLDRLGYRLAAIAFPIWTIGPLILGSVWAEVSWGRYWNWDPKEVWALVTWLVYAAYLHARATAGWKGSKASVVALVGYATAVFSYFGVNFLFAGLHVYAT